MFSLRLPPSIEKRLHRIAILRGETKTSLTVQAVEEYLERAEELSPDLSDEDQKEQNRLMASKQYDDFIKNNDRWNDTLLHQFEEICRWIERGHVWTHKPTGNGHADGCPYGTNYVVGYTVVNQNDSDKYLAVISKYTNGHKGIHTRHRYVIPYSEWIKNMHELDTKV